MSCSTSRTAQTESREQLTERVVEVEVHDTLRQVDTVMVNNIVRVYQKGDTVYRDSTITVYVVRQNQSVALQKSRQDSVRTEYKYLTKVEERTVYRTPRWAWATMALLAVAAIAMGALLYVRRKTRI